MKNQRKVAISPQNKEYSISKTSIYVSHKSEQWKVMQSSHNALCHNISRIGLWRYHFEDGCIEWATQSCSLLCGRHRRELFALLRFEWPVWRYSTFFAICTAEWSLAILVLWWRDVSLLRERGLAIAAIITFGLQFNDTKISTRSTVSNTFFFV